MGKDANELIANWGPPSRVMSDGKGGQVLVYAESREWVTPGRARTTYTDYGYGQGVARTTYTPATVDGYTAYRMFWVNSENRVYSWSWKGL
jgi:hypothetical protein